MKKIFNNSTQLTEIAKQKTCPRCKGFGSNLNDIDICPLCNGYGYLWVNNTSGNTLKMYGRTGQEQFY